MESKPVVKRDFKKGISLEDGRRRREESSVKLRKEKKEEGIAKKRNLALNNINIGGDVQEASNESKGDMSGNVNGKAHIVDDIPELYVKLRSTDVATQVQAIRGFRRLLSIENNPPVQQCIDCGAIPYFVSFLQRCDSTELQFEAAWALTNIASTDRTRLVVECNAVPHLVALLRSVNADVREQSAWCLGNVAGDGAELRDYVISQGALAPLLDNIRQPASVTLLRNCVWSLSNFCRGKPQPAIPLIAEALPILAGVISQHPDLETVIDAIWALSYVSDGSDDRIQAVVDLGVVPILVDQLVSGKNTLVVPALRTLGNIVSGNEVQTQSVVSANVLPALVPLLTSSKKNIRKETCWMLSNIAAGTMDQMNQLFNTPHLLSHVLQQLSSATEWDVRKEAVWVISNIATTGNHYHVIRLVEQGAIRPLCELLDVHEVKVLLIAMEALEAILKVSQEASNKQQCANYAQLIDEAGGVDSLERLQEHENQNVYAKAVSIIETYFGVDDDDEESENLAPQTASTGNTFSFGIPQQQQNNSKLTDFNNFGTNNNIFTSVGKHQFTF